MHNISKLDREQKEAIGLLQAGTFLEHFDLMLYIHMAVLLNELFFPKTDPHTASLLTAFTVCTSFIFRPIGALFFGWLGDNVGRKSTIVLTTIMMSASCIIMAVLPTYAEIGISAAWIMTICRISQSISSMGEIMGAEIYITESIPRPTCYPIVASIGVVAMLGVMVALGVATLVTSYLLNWRIAFWIGAVIALIGALARTRLRETPDFLELKRKQIKQTLSQLNEEVTLKHDMATQAKHDFDWKESVPYKTLFAFFFLQCGYPLTFYFAFMYFNSMLQNDFGYSSEAIISRNFLLSIVMLVSYILWTVMSAYFHPLRIIKIRGWIALLLMIAMPFFILNITTSTQLFFIQSLLLLFTLGSMPSDAVLIYHLPIFRRFTYASFLFSIAYALMFILTSFGLVYLGDKLGPIGLWLVIIPIPVAYLLSILYFEKLELKVGIDLKKRTYPGKIGTKPLHVETH
jgi:MFS transporter, MHS family, proline/betaine transporter